MTYNFDEIIGRHGTNTLKVELLDSFFGSKGLIPMWAADVDFHIPPFVFEAIICLPSFK
jgi:cystathionine beta-lyase